MGIGLFVDARRILMLSDGWRTHVSWGPRFNTWDDDNVMVLATYYSTQYLLWEIKTTRRRIIFFLFWIHQDEETDKDEPNKWWRLFWRDLSKDQKTSLLGSCDWDFIMLRRLKHGKNCWKKLKQFWKEMIFPAVQKPEKDAAWPVETATTTWTNFYRRWQHANYPQCDGLGVLYALEERIQEQQPLFIYDGWPAWSYINTKKGMARWMVV